MNALFHAIAFLTRLPVPRLSNSSRDWQNSVAFYPLVGGLLGMLLWLAALLAGKLLPPLLTAVLTLVFWVYLTGGLHLDGWMDVADGLGSNRSRERMLEIMKDSRVGAMGVIAAILLVMIKVAAIYELVATPLWLIVPPLVARLLLPWVIWQFPYLSANGLGNGLRTGLNYAKLVSGLLLGLLVLFLLFHIAGIVAALAAGVIAWLYARHLIKQLGGLNGDCYGAIVELTEAVALLLILFAGRIGL